MLYYTSQKLVWKFDLKKH